MFMDFIYPFFITFIFIFLSELGDKTQLLVLSFSTKGKASFILLGVAIGTFFSHGLAILFGSQIASFQDDTFQFYLTLFTYLSFLLFGLWGFYSSHKDNNSNEHNLSFLQRFPFFNVHYVFVVAFSIIAGELGDKTFLASLGAGLQYPDAKISLILGSIFGMVASNSIAIFFGKFLENKLKPDLMQTLSNIIFILFGLFGLFSLLMDLI